MMKNDLLTSIVAAVLGSVVAFLICNTLLPEIETASFKKLQDNSSSYDLTEPNVEVFNYRALNPTVEVYVGDCTEYDEYGNCITNQDDSTKEEEMDTPTDDAEEEIEDLINDDTSNQDEPTQEDQNGSTN